MTNRYDLLVIGGGSGGLAHAQRAAQYGANAAVVEYGPLGGTCVNVGCVPKKVMWYAAHHAQQFHHAPDYGFDVEVKGHDWSALKTRRDAYIERLNGIYENNLDKQGVTYIAGAASFVDANTVSVEGQEYEADRIVIATGGRPMVPDIPGAELGITSDGFFELEERPQRVLIAGSGYVAVELAGVFNALGSDVQLVVRKDGVLRSFDSMLSTQLMEAMDKNGIELSRDAMTTIRIVNIIIATIVLFVSSIALADTVDKYLSGDTFLIHNVTIIDGLGNAQALHQDIFIKGGKITAIMPTGKTKPTGSPTVIEGKGLTAMPGLIDMHIHLQGGWAGGIIPGKRYKNKYDDKNNKRFSRFFTAEFINQRRGTSDCCASRCITGCAWKHDFGLSVGMEAGRRCH